MFSVGCGLRRSPMTHSDSPWLMCCSGWVPAGRLRRPNNNFVEIRAADYAFAGPSVAETTTAVFVRCRWRTRTDPGLVCSLGRVNWFYVYCRLRSRSRILLFWTIFLDLPILQIVGLIVFVLCVLVKLLWATYCLQFNCLWHCDQLVTRKFYQRIRIIQHNFYWQRYCLFLICIILNFNAVCSDFKVHFWDSVNYRIYNFS